MIWHSLRHSVDKTVRSGWPRVKNLGVQSWAAILDTVLQTARHPLQHLRLQDYNRPASLLHASA